MRRADLVTAGLAIAVHAGLALAVTGFMKPSKPPSKPVMLEFKRREPPAAAPVGAPAPVARTLAPPRAPSTRKVAVRTRSVPAPAPAAAHPSAAPTPVYAVAMTSPTDVGGAVAVQATGGGSADGRPGGTGSGPSDSTGVGSGGFKPASARDVGVMPEVDADACGRAATYPREAEQSGVEGDVRLRVALNERGQVHNVKVLSGLGRGLDAAAVEAIKHRCKFKPAIDREGRTVAFVIESYKFHFELPH